MHKYIYLVIIIFVISCKPEQRPVNYGSDECEYCKMKIMDHRYGSEYVSKKGKIYTFDAAECLIEYLHNNKVAEKATAILLVTPYTDPETLIDAREATYLVSRKMPSPMGAYLSSFSDRQTAEKFQEEKGGRIFTWDELTADFHNIKHEVINSEE